MKGAQKGLVVPIWAIRRLFASRDPDAIIGSVFLLLIWAGFMVLIILDP